MIFYTFDESWTINLSLVGREGHYTFTVPSPSDFLPT